MTSRIVILLLCLVGFVMPAMAQSPVLDAGQREEVARIMQAALERERANSSMPSMSVAVFDREGIIWAGASGNADKEGKIPATVRTTYRAGSISKLFTDIMIMQEVGKGVLDLDAPIQTYLPDFRPANRYRTPITLRSLTAHRSGMVREPSVGSYFDEVSPPIEEVVAALNQTELVAEPGTFVKYSNGAIQLLGYVLERATGRSYDQLVAERIFAPVGMTQSGFSIQPFRGSIAYAQYAPYGQPRLDAPLFDLGVDAAGGLAADVIDMSAFGRMILNGGQGDYGRVIEPAALLAMQKIQYAEPDQTTGFGIGFQVGRVDGAVKVGHGGAIYGYTADLQMIPELGIGVVAMGTIDLAREPFNLSDLGLRVMKALLEGQPVPQVPLAYTDPSPALINRITGWYEGADGSLVIRDIGGKALFEAPRTTGQVRMLGARPVLYSDLAFEGDVTFDPLGTWVQIDQRRYTRAERKRPAEADPALVPLIGYYLRGSNALIIYERDGRPYINIEWSAYEPMRQTGPDELTFLDDSLLYPREKLTFLRDTQGMVTTASLGGILFERAATGAVMSAPERADARARLEAASPAARRAAPPQEHGNFLSPDLVDLREFDTALRFDVRYATDENFMGAPVYRKPVALLQRPAAAALAQANERLAQAGLGITFHDGYRPWYVTKLFWDATPDDKKVFVADPSEGSRHNRGAAVDISLYDLATGQPVSTTAEYDETTPRSYPAFVGGTSLERWRRDLLIAAMTDANFDVYPYEWWHFDYRDWRRYPILNLDEGQ